MHEARRPTSAPLFVTEPAIPVICMFFCGMQQGQWTDSDADRYFVGVGESAGGQGAGPRGGRQQRITEDRPTGAAGRALAITSGHSCKTDPEAYFWRLFSSCLRLQGACRAGAAAAAGARVPGSKPRMPGWHVPKPRAAEIESFNFLFAPPIKLFLPCWRPRSVDTLTACSISPH
jgi:hypothetical protein